MHNGVVTGSNLRFARGAALCAASVLLLSSCSGSDSEPTDPPTDAAGSASASAAADKGGAAPSSSPSAEAYLPVPDGVSLSVPGSDLALGDTATVAYEPRQDTVGVLDLSVTALQETTFEESFQGWKLDAATKKSTPYFVRAKVENVGRSNLGGQRVPLYLLDDQQTLVEPSSFDGDFEPCPSTPLPKEFRAKDKATVCLVYLAAPGTTLEGVTFRPDQDFDAITWTGQVQRPGGQGSDQKGSDRKGSDRKGPDQKGTDQKGTDQKGSDRKASSGAG